jgi:hypothetical protein
VTTTTQDAKFKRDVIPDNALEEAVGWIANNMEPEEVFSDDQLSTWAVHNGYALEE